MVEATGASGGWTALGVAELGSALGSGRTSALDVTRAFLDRIAALDPTLNAFVRVDPGAEEQAARADRRLARGRGGPLTGIPVAIKDNIDVAGLETTCASRLLGDHRPARDATAVGRLREAGAVVLGKTNLDEFGMGSSCEHSAIGPTRNPWDPERVPGGSSGGAAAALAARMTPAALGSDTGGSARQPAAFCGVVGLKTTYGRVSRSGPVAFASSLDQIGPMARRVVDAAWLLACVAGPDAADMTASDAPRDDYPAACDRGVEGLRVGLPREYLDPGPEAEIAEAVRRSAERLERAGAAVREVSLPHARHAIATYRLVANAEASSNLARFDGVRFGRRFEGGDDAGATTAVTRGRWLGHEVQRHIMLGTFALAADHRGGFYDRAMRARTLIRRDFVAVFEDGIDLLLAPATPTTAFRIGEKIDDPLRMHLSDVYTVSANLAGLPALVVPVGRDRDGLPVGAQLIGRDFGEFELLRAGALLERQYDQAAPRDAGARPAGGPPEARG